MKRPVLLILGIICCMGWFYGFALMQGQAELGEETWERFIHPPSSTGSLSLEEQINAGERNLRSTIIEMGAKAERIRNERNFAFFIGSVGIVLIGIWLFIPGAVHSQSGAKAAADNKTTTEVFASERQTYNSRLKSDGELWEILEHENKYIPALVKEVREELLKRGKDTSKNSGT